MAIDFAANAGLLEEVRQLHQQSVHQSWVNTNVLQISSSGKRIKDRVDVVHGVVQLVDGSGPRHLERAVRIMRACFKKHANVVG